LIRINERNEIDWINYRKGEEKTSVLESVFKEFTSNLTSLSFVSFLNGKSFKNLPDCLIEYRIIDRYVNKPKYINLPYRTEKEIDDIINLNNLDTYYNKDQLDIDKICKYLTDTYNVIFHFDLDLGIIGVNKILGKITFNPLEIFVCKELQKNKYRFRFTLAHEIGHLILHHDNLKKYLDENLDNETTIDIIHDDIISFYNNRLEIQANIFASRLLIPQEKLIHHVAAYFVRERIHKGYLFVDHQYCNIDLTNRLLKELQDHFFVSKEVARIRLIKEGLLRDKYDLHFLTTRK